MDRTRRIAQQVLSRYPSVFGTDYEKNKEALDEMALIPSKQLRNKVAGYLAKSRKLEEDDEEETPEGESKE